MTAFTQINTLPLVEAAVAYGRLGFKVFPAMANDKRPRQGLLWKQTATSDETTIRQLWAQHGQDSNVAIATGEPSGIDVVDPDYKNGVKRGNESLSIIVGDTPMTCPYERTASGGFHLLFKHQPGFKNFNNRGQVGGLDLKTTGGYIIAAPSVVEGHPYLWQVDGEVGTMPKALEAFCQWESTASEAVRDPGQPLPTPGYVDLARIEQALEYISPECSYDHWYKIGMAIHYETQGSDDGFHIWDAWSANGNYPESGDPNYPLINKWRSFKATGANPITIATVFNWARTNGWSDGAPSAYEVFTAIQPPELPATETPPLTRYLDLAQIRAHDPVINWAVKGIQECDTINLIIGQSGSYKSFIELDKALHMATGKDWCGRETKHGPVLYLAGEGSAGLIRRAQAWCNYHGLDQDDVPFLLNNYALDLSTWELLQLVYNDCVEVAQRYGQPPVLIVIDTLSASTNGIDENSSTEMAGFLARLAAALRTPTGAAVDLVHHTGHTDQERARGSYTLKANVDADCLISKSEADKYVAVVESGKTKDGEQFGTLTFDMVKQTIKLDPDTMEVTDSLVAVYREVVETPVAVKTQRARAVNTKANNRMLEAMQMAQYHIEEGGGQLTPDGSIQILLSDITTQVDMAYGREYREAGIDAKNSPSNKTITRDLLNFIPEKEANAISIGGGKQAHREKIGNAKVWTVILTELRTPDWLS